MCTTVPTRRRMLVIVAGACLAGGIAAAGAAPAKKPSVKPPAGKKAAPARRPAQPQAPTPGQPGPILRKFLAGPMKDHSEIVYAARPAGRDHWYVNFGYYSDDSEYPRTRSWKQAEGVYWGYPQGARLCRMNLRTGKTTVLLDDPRGGVRDPQVHYSGRKILFAYRKGGTHTYHLYEIGADGRNLRQLTDGPDDDIEPTYLPDGGILFGSSRCHRFVACWYSRVATLHRCDGDGKNLRMISASTEHDNTPWVLPDGRVIYMRWEYVDRSQVHYHHLWTTNPDGTGTTVYYGNLHPGIAMLDAKPIPGTNKVICSFSPGHGRAEHMGFMTEVDPGAGPDDPGRVRQVTRRGWSTRDPYAVAEGCYLAAERRGIFVVDGAGGAELVCSPSAADAKRKIEFHEPRLLRPRKREPAIAPRVNLAQTTGTLFLSDIYAGRNMQGVRRGEIKKLLVLESLPKPVNFSGGMQPLTIGGSFLLSRIVGTVPVEPNGSAYMEVPARRGLFFVALDKNDLSVKRMQSFLNVEPGETAGCVGCHEQRTSAPHTAQVMASLAGRVPTPVEPCADVPDVIDFPRDVQPVLDKYCVSCHNPDRRDGKVDLCGDHTPGYSTSYWTILNHRLVSDGRNQPTSNRPPRSIGTCASPLLKYFKPSHYDVQPTQRDLRLVRLWIETSATYPGTYAALGCGMYSVRLPALQRCAPCHAKTVKGAKGPATHFRFGQAGSYQQLCNLDRPAKSLILQAPLAKSAGGLGVVMNKAKTPLFASKADPDYRRILAAIEACSAQLKKGKRFDMPGFRPNRHYIREMQRFGHLPATLGPSDPVDPYKTDQAYWRSFWPKGE